MLIKGPNTIKWGDNEIDNIEEVSVEYESASEEYETIQGKTYEIDGPQKVSASLTLLASDIPTLAALLPQNFVPNGSDLSTGETVNHAQGAIDVNAKDCDEDIIYNNFDIISCNNPSQVFRIVNARTRFDGYEVDNKIHKAMVKIIGEADSDEAAVQIFREGTINTVS